MHRHHRAGALFVALSLLAIAGPMVGPPSAAADERSEIDLLKRQIEELKRSDAEKSRQLDELKDMVRALAPARPGRVVKGAAGAAAPASAARPAPALGPQEALEREVGLAEREPPLGAPGGTPEIGKSEGRPAQRFDATGGGSFGTTGLGTAGLTDSGPASSSAGTTLGSDFLSRQIGGGRLRLIDISFDTLVVAGGSSAPDSEISTLEGGGHDPKRNGFTLQQAELSLSGAVDPYFTGEAHIVYTPGGVELEEAFMTTQSLPWNLQVEAGYFLTEFGRINPTHPHAWQWIDQPVVNSRMFGGDGLRSPGFRVGWLAPVPWYSEWNIGAQNANEGEFTTSFRSEEAIGGRPGEFLNTSSMTDLLYLVRTANFASVTDNTTALFGLSGLFGPNSTGADARTFLYGADLTMKWRPAQNFRGWPFVLWQTEVMRRDYTADPIVADTATVASTATAGSIFASASAGQSARLARPSHSHDVVDGGGDVAVAEDIPGALLRDWGLYSQLLYGFHPQWSAGLRGEWASGHGQSYPDGRESDPFRDDRFRMSPIVIFQPSEFSRLRLQYNYDHALHLPGAHDAHSVWFGAEILYGFHPAHKY